MDDLEKQNIKRAKVSTWLDVTAVIIFIVILTGKATFNAPLLVTGWALMGLSWVNTKNIYEEGINNGK